MTRDDIIRMAEEAGIVVTGEAVWRLCDLVAAAEREACAQLCDALSSAADCAEAIRSKAHPRHVQD